MTYHHTHNLEQVCSKHPGLGATPHDVDEYPWTADLRKEDCGRNVMKCQDCGAGHPLIPSQRPTLQEACAVGGVAIETWRRILTMPPPLHGDHWSCVMRPGAWEYTRPEAEAMRYALARAGYEEEPDGPDRPFGTRWRLTR